MWPMKHLINEVSACTHCTKFLPLGPRPVISVHPTSKLVIIGQAPGIRVHRSGIPWDDKSGDNLRLWLGMEKETFYNPEKVAIIPMGFCYPGTGKSGDLPPRKECAPLWHERLLQEMPQVELTLLIGNYAQKYYLGKQRERNLTETVRQFENYLPRYLPLPHPSPRNNIWQKKNPWFNSIVIPRLREITERICR